MKCASEMPLEVASSGKVGVTELALDLTRVPGHVGSQRVDTQAAEVAIRTVDGLDGHLPDDWIRLD